MTPPAALLKGSRRLSLDEFGVEFTAAWSQLSRRFLKVESWQEYQELEATSSQDAYKRGDVALARELLRSEAEAERPLYEDIKWKGIDYARLRLVQFPLTPYLRYEIMAYAIRGEMGETIEVAEFPPALQLPSDDYFDFLLFDTSVGLVHDYGSGAVGIQSGGWLVRDPEIIAILEQKALAIRASARPISEFLTTREI